MKVSESLWHRVNTVPTFTVTNSLSQPFTLDVKLISHKSIPPQSFWFLLDWFLRSWTCTYPAKWALAFVRFSFFFFSGYVC